MLKRAQQHDRTEAMVVVNEGRKVPVFVLWWGWWRAWSGNPLFSIGDNITFHGQGLGFRSYSYM